MSEADRDVTTAAGLDDALIGIAQRCGQPSLAIYSVPAVIEILRGRDGMSEDEAHEFFSFNIEGAWVGGDDAAVRPSLLSR